MLTFLSGCWKDNQKLSFNDIWGTSREGECSAIINKCQHGTPQSIACVCRVSGIFAVGVSETRLYRSGFTKSLQREAVADVWALASLRCRFHNFDCITFNLVNSE